MNLDHGHSILRYGKDLMFILIKTFNVKTTFSKLLQLYIKFFREITNRDKNNPNNRKNTKGEKPQKVAVKRNISLF